MGQALYRKYRSTSLSEIVGQEHITTALEQALKTGRISHAYLFTGPRGTGKTSIARILAHAINDLPYSGDAHMDIIEIDAASNRRIDEIRDLRDKVYIAPTSAKYKVYIIDEVHMLTREAFNALLKTLEEPPAHVVFILATTDAHKLPETIISRTQRYSFRPVDTDKVVGHLKHIAKTEKISVDNAALELLAQHGEGSFRDSISLLDQAGNHGDSITVDTVRVQLGIPPEEAVLQLLESLSAANISAPVSTLQELYDAGYRAATIAEQLARLIRTRLADDTLLMPAPNALYILKQLLGVAAAHSPERYLEIVLMEAVVPAEAPAPAPAETPKEAPKKAVKTQTPAPQPAPKNEPVPEPEAPKPARKPAAGKTVLDDTSWTAVLAELKKQYNTIYGIVRMAHTDFTQAGTVTLSFAFAFHQKRISDPKNRKIVTDCIGDVTGQQVHLVCEVSKEPKARPAPAKTDESLQDISAVFGGGELL
jgi:DNA polymerase-3 subunit gamma/tau